ncbi:hypothetical protein GGI20_004612, partial [Coemansia sp. BCRC 34301]
MSDSKSESDIAAAPPNSAAATATTVADPLDAAGYSEASSNARKVKKQFAEYPGDEKPPAEHGVDWEKSNVKPVV